MTASTTDLLAGKIATVTYNLVAGPAGSTTQESSAGAIAWTNGSLVTAYGTTHTAYGSVDGRMGGLAIQTFVTFDLGALYDISMVNVFLGWNDSGRDDAAFSTVASYSKGGDNTGAITTPVTNLHSIVDTAGGTTAIASGVRYVQLHFTDADNGWAGLAEVDVIGTAAVPEPSALFLAGLGGLAVISRRRRA